MGTTIGFIDYVAFHRGLYERNDVYLADLLHYMDRQIDKDDLARCAETNTPSEKYEELQHFLDTIVDTYDVDYVYILKPLVLSDKDNCLIIINGITQEEYESDYEDLYFLGDIPHDSFPLSTMKSFFSAMEKPGEISFDQDEEATEWGYDYTGMLPLQDSTGRVFALLCVDISVSAIRAQIFWHMLNVVVIIVIIGTVFCILFLLWSRRYITYPVEELVRSVADFAQTSHNQTNPEKLVYNEPRIHTKNEVESLSHAITQMAHDMKQYAVTISAAENKVTNLQQNVAKLDVLAYQDALTHVKNKASYDRAMANLNAKIAGKEAEFAIVMVDLNYLKRINDTYGHERGNDYITGSCHIICEIFEHSPVYRIGGDEFTVILERRDYNDRDQLYHQLLNAFSESSAEESRAPWLRYSAAAGMAAFTEKTDTSAEDVFKNADKIMYENKLSMHSCR
ncbi:MAG: GGDEF domain-containing protein [Treponema sp.]|nr:GGDEF domain-containing protein [Treponema sp.]